MKTFQQYLREYIDLEELNLDYFLEPILTGPIHNTDKQYQEYTLWVFTEIWEKYLYELLEENLILEDGKSISIDSSLSNASLNNLSDDFDALAYVKGDSLNILIKEYVMDFLESSDIIHLLETKMNQQIHQYISRHLYIKLKDINDIQLEDSYIRYSFVFCAGNQLPPEDQYGHSYNLFKILFLEKLEQVSGIKLTDKEVASCSVGTARSKFLAFYFIKLELMNKATSQYVARYGHRLAINKAIDYNPILVLHWKKE